MQRVVEMLLLEKARDSIASLVVHQDRAEKGLLRLEIMGRGTEDRRLGSRRQWANQCAHRSRVAKTGHGARAGACEQWGELCSLTTRETGAAQHRARQTGWGGMWPSRTRKSCSAV